MLTRGSAFSLSRIRVSADAMEMEMAMTANGATTPTCWLRDSCRCFHGGSAVFSGVVARRGGVANKEEELATRCKCSDGVEAAAMVVRRRERRGASRGLMRGGRRRCCVKEEMREVQRT